jgi:hypothetical protein
MQKQQALNCNAEVAGASLQFRSSTHYTVMQKQQALRCNAEVAEQALH